MDDNDEKNVDIKKQYSGTVYQIKMLFILLWRGMKIADSFYLRTEVKEAEKFDDALFYYKNDGEDKYHLRYIQAKDVEYSGAELKYSNFVTDQEKAVANLKKYFISYRKIKLKTADKYLDDFILCTSYKVPLEIKKSNNAKNDQILKFEEQNVPDLLFNCKDWQGWKKYKVTQISSELLESLKHATNLELLAQELTKCFTTCKTEKKNEVIIDFENFWFSVYENAFKSEKVFTKQMVVGINENFLAAKYNNLKKPKIHEADIMNLQRHFCNECEKRTSLDSTQLANIKMDDDFQRILETKEFKKTSGPLEDEKLQKFAIDLVDYLLCDKTTYFDKSYFDDPNIFNLLKRILKSKEVLVFSKDFINGENLSESCKEFRTILLEYYGSKLLNFFLREKNFKVDATFETIFCHADIMRASDVTEEDLKILAKRLGEYIVYEKSLNDSDVFISHYSLLQSIFKKTGIRTIKFTGNFIQNENLSKNVQFLRSHLLIFCAIEELRNQKIILLQKQLQSHETGMTKLANNIAEFFRNRKPYTYDCNYPFCCDTFVNNDKIEEEIKTFFQKFSIVETPHGDELLNAVNKEICEEFGFLDDTFASKYLFEETEKWFKQTEETPLDKSRVVNFFSHIRKEMEKKMTIGAFYAEKLKSLNIFFNSVTDTWKDYLLPLNKTNKKSTKERFLLLSAEEPVLTAIKVKQVLNSISYYRAQDSYILSSATMLLLMENRVKTIFVAKNSCNLMIIVDDIGKENSSRFLLFVNAIYVIMKQNFGKQIILITNEKSNTLKNDLIFDFDEDKDSYDFIHFTPESQNYILQKNVNFQGKEIPLKLIIDNCFELIDSHTLMQLIEKNDVLKIGEKLEPFKEYDEHCYIERKIGLHKIRDSFFYKTFANCLFLIESETVDESHKFLSSKNVKKNQICSSKIFSQFSGEATFICVESKQAEEEFKKICKLMPNVHVFWFKVINTDLLWFQCSENSFKVLGSGDSPMSFTEPYYVSEGVALEFMNHLQNVAIVDSAGMGKSTILTNLSEAMKNNKTLKWVIRMDLNKYTKYFLKLKQECKIQEKSKKKFNFRNIDDIGHDYGKLILDSLFDRNVSEMASKTFETRILEKMFQRNQVLLILDGFDEISPDYESLIMFVLKTVKCHTKNQIWITSRVTFKNSLENNLKTLCYTLMPFSVNDQINFMTKFWQVNWKGSWTAKQKRHAEKYATILVVEFNKMAKKQNGDIIGIPLQSKMLAIVFQENTNENDSADNWQGCFNFLKASEKCEKDTCYCVPKLSDKLQNVYVFYTDFVESQFDRHFETKKEFDYSKPGWSDDRNVLYSEQHKLHNILGICEIVDGDNLEVLLNMDEKRMKKEWLEKFKDGSANYGLVNRVDDNNEPLFVHLTYAEYFAAHFLKEKMIKFPFEVFHIIDIILQSEVPVFVFGIKHLIKTEVDIDKLKEAMEGTTVLNFVSKHGFSNCVKNFMNEDNYSDVFPQIDEFHKTSLHWAAEFSQKKSVILISLHKWYQLNRYDRFLNCDILTDVDNTKSGSHFLYYQREAIPFLLSEIICLKDNSRKTAVEYATEKEITNLLNDFANVGKNALIPTDKLKMEIQKLEQLNDFTKFFDINAVIKNTFFNLFYYISYETIEILFNNCEKSMLKALIYPDHEQIYFVVDICRRSDFNPCQKKCIFQRFLSTLSNLDAPLTKYIEYILCAALSYDCDDVFNHFTEHVNVCLSLDSFVAYYIAACEANNVNGVTRLLELCDVSECETSDPFNIALMRNTNFKILELILNYFSEENFINLKDSSGDIPLCILADAYLHAPLTDLDPTILQKIKFLLAKGANVNVPNNRGWTAWDYAVGENNDNLIKLFLPKIENATTQKIFFEEYYDKQCCNKLMDKKYEKYLLKLAVLKDKTLCRFLISKGANVNVRDENGKTPLHYACENNVDRNTVELLLDSGACYEAEDNDKRTPLELCKENSGIMRILNERKAMFERMINKGVILYYEFGLKTINKKKQTIWHFVTASGHYENLRKLMTDRENDDSMNFQDLNGNTPLHLAVERGFVRIVEELLNHGAFYNVENSNNETAETIAQRNNYDNIKKIFEEISKLFKAAKENILGPFKFGFRYSKVRDCHGKTLLHYAVLTNHYETANLLTLYASKTINFTDKYEKTPLCYAAKNDNTDIVKLLLKRGAKIKDDEYTEQENSCTVILGLIIKLFSHLYNNEVEELKTRVRSLIDSPIRNVSLEVILNSNNHVDKNFIQYAQEMNDYDLVVFLLQNGAHIWERETRGIRTAALFNLIQNIFKYVVLGYFETSSIIKLVEYHSLTAIVTNVKVGADRETLLHKAVGADNFELVKWLIKKGADVCAEDYFGQKPSENASEEMCKFLQTFMSNSDQ